MNEWISVSERLPRSGQTVIVTGGNDAWSVGKYCGVVKDNPALWLWGKNKVFAVSYWMPKAGALPPVPEEQI